jgi:hypothetical protein
MKIYNKCSSTARLNHKHKFNHRIQSITQSMEILIRTGKGEVIFGRDGCFLPTIGTTTPNGFTTSHPQPRPQCSERDSFSFLHDSEGRRLLSSSHKILETRFLYTKKGGLRENFLSHTSASFNILYQEPSQGLLQPK